MDLALVAHLSAINGQRAFPALLRRFPYLSRNAEDRDHRLRRHRQAVSDYDAVEAFRARATQPGTSPSSAVPPRTRTSYFQNREACNTYYDAVPGIVEHYMEESRQADRPQVSICSITSAHPDADRVIVIMGSGCEVGRRSRRLPQRNAAKSVGLMKVHLYRPFSCGHSLLARHPRHLSRRSPFSTAPRNPVPMGEPLYQDVCTAFCRGRQARRQDRRRPLRSGLQGIHPRHGQGRLSTT